MQRSSSALRPLAQLPSQASDSALVVRRRSKSHSMIFVARNWESQEGGQTRPAYLMAGKHTNSGWGVGT
jgi:hypothetical protein